MDIGSFIPLNYKVLAPSQVVGNGISEPSTVGIVGWWLKVIQEITNEQTHGLRTLKKPEDQTASSNLL